MNVRERTEAIEYKLLSPYAAKSRESRRKYSLEACPFRTAYQRDRDRILHSKAFRRLKHKTQVYILSGDHYRTRMTHSLEVAQIARTIARSLQLNEDLTEAISLGHDVGHTPFGHSGEAAMDKLTGHFVHNEQSLRVVEFLENDGEGLNLTFEVKDGILNHSGRHSPKTLEGRVVHLADRIAYLCHDYDDSLRARMLEPQDLPGLVYNRIGHMPSAMIAHMVSDVIMASEGETEISMSPPMQAAVDEFREFMFKNIYHSEVLAKERKQAVFVLQELYGYFMKNTSELPKEFFEREKRWGKKQTVTDYVSGLTDSYAVQLFNKIFIPPVGVMI
jgi:dGTPase